jgi:hypothetical protein
VERPSPRELWSRLEPLHAVTYFTEECRRAGRDAGMAGFWMSYFAQRASPMGPVPAAVVEATFFNFHPDMVRRAVPEAWRRAEPADLVSIRRTAAAAALRRLVPAVEAAAERLVPALRRVIDAADGSGRPLFSANRAVAPAGDPVAALWECCTCLREHRGDGHVAALCAAGIDGCEAHVLLSAVEGVPASLLQEARGWSEQDWADAVHRLGRRHLMAGTDPTTAGRVRRHEVEATTDELAGRPYRVLGDAELVSVGELLAPLARAVVAGGVVPYPNPMGLPPPDPAGNGIARPDRRAGSRR